MSKSTTDAIILSAAIIGIISGIAITLDIAFNRWKYLKAFGVWLKNLFEIDSEPVVLNIPSPPPGLRKPQRPLVPPVPPQQAAYAAAPQLITGDGVTKTLRKYIIYGEEKLLAYETTRIGIANAHYLVVRQRPGQPEQSKWTPNPWDANAQWFVWYKEWEQSSRGFGGASGTGLDGKPPF